MSDEDDLNMARKAIDGDASALIRIIDRRIGLALGVVSEDDSRARKRMMEQLLGMIEAATTAPHRDPMEAIQNTMEIMRRLSQVRDIHPTEAVSSDLSAVDDIARA